MWRLHHPAAGKNSCIDLPDMSESGPNRNTKLTSALAIGPLAIIPAMLLAISLLKIIYPMAETGLWRQYHSGLVMCFFGLLLSYSLTFLYGLPVYWLLSKFNRYNLPMVVLASLIPALLLLLFNQEQWQYYLAMGYFSVFVAATCWVISIRKN